MTSSSRHLPWILAGVLGACTQPSEPSGLGPKPTLAGKLGVAEFQPIGTSSTRPIEIRFEAPVVAEDALGTDRPAGEIVTFAPPLPGVARFVAVDRLVYTPSEPFRPATRYVAKVVVPGKPASSAQSFEFNSPLLELVKVEPFFGAGRKGEVFVNLELSLPVALEDARRTISFARKPGGTPVSATLETQAPGAALAFRLQGVDPSDGAVELEVTLARDLRAAAGGEPLGADVTRSLTIQKPEALTITNVYPSQDDGKYSIRVYFNDELDPAAAERAITVSPSTKWKASATYRGLLLEGNFKAGSSYTVTVKKGLVGRSGGGLDADFSRVVVIADLEPELRFGQAGGTYLLKKGARRLALESINVGRARLMVWKVLDRNLVHVVPQLRTESRVCDDEGCYDVVPDEESMSYDYSGDSGYYFYGNFSTMGPLVESSELALGGAKNEWAKTTLQFDALDKDPRPGLYKVRIQDAEAGWRSVERWLLATDLGLTAKVGRAEAEVTVVSLSTLKPVAGAQVEFRTQTNDAVGKVETNAAGQAKISLAALRPGEPLSMITATKDGDFSYIGLAGTAIRTTDFDVGGEGESTGAYEAFAYLDRGVYRPGDTAHLSVVVRDRALATPPPFPFSVEVRDPRGADYATFRSTTERDGAATFDVSFPMDARTGSYSVRVLGGGSAVLGRATIKVEEFMPDRIKVDVRAEKAVAEAGETLGFAVESAYLFGAPAANLAVDAACVTEVAPLPKQELYSSFAFSPDARTRSEDSLGESALDASGRGSYSCAANDTGAPRPTRVSLVATVSERGGRAVTGVGSTIVHALPHYVGLRRNSASYYAEVGKPAELELVVIDRSGEPLADVEVEVAIDQVEYKSTVRLVNGRYQYISERTTQPATTVKVRSKKGPTPIAFSAERTGSYAARVQNGSATATLEFWAAGSGYAGWDMKNPDQVGLTVEKGSYQVGEVAKVMVRAPFAGTAFVSVERDRVLWSSVVELSGNSGELTFPVSREMGPNAYVVVQLVRPVLRSSEKLAPSRAIGVVPFKVDMEKHRLGVSLSVPERLRPGQTLEAEVRTTGGRGKVQVTLAAVDEGILRITGFASPDAFGFFARKRRLQVSTHDMFDQLVPELDGGVGGTPTGGGGDETRQKHLNPVSVKRVKPVALWSGLVTLDAGGKGTVKLDVPEFQGSLRVMVVAFEGEKFGGAAKNVEIRDPIVLTPTLPRFVAPLDRFQVPVEVYNGTDRDAEIEVKIVAEGRVKPTSEATKRVNVKSKAMGFTTFELAADEVVGAAKIVLSAKGNGEETRATTELPIRPASTTVTDARIGIAKAGAPLTAKVPGGFLAGSLKVKVAAGAAPWSQFGPALQYLIQYPYGCLEQTTSRTLPLLYLRDLAKGSAPELAEDRGVDVYIQAGIGRVSGMAMSSGAFAYWPGSTWGYGWTSIYATHFLVEAKRAGYQVDDRVLDRALTHLSQVAGQATLGVYGDARADFTTRAYAMYVLGLAGRPNGSAVLYAAEELRRALEGKGARDVRTDDETRALIAGALMLGGDRTRGQQLLLSDLSLASAARDGWHWSAARADALLLTVLADVDPTHKSVPKLIKSLSDRAKVGRWYTTQENALALLALGKIGRALGEANFTGQIKAGGAVVAKFDSRTAGSVVLDGRAEVGAEVAVEVTGTGVAFASIAFEGIPAEPRPASSRGIRVSRKYLDDQGREIDARRLEQGQTVVVRLGVSTPAAARIANVALVDLLPAGLEIENPRLSGDQVAPWMKDWIEQEYVDIRDDRLLAFTGVSPGAERYFYYRARAVSVGEFVHPHVMVEAMYDPETQAYDGAGRMTIVARESP